VNSPSPTIRRRRAGLRHSGKSTSRRCGICVALSATLLSLPLRLAAAEPATESVSVVVRTADRDGFSGRMQRLSLESGATLRTESGAELSIPRRDLVRVSVQGTGSTSKRCDITLTLVDGDFLCGRVVDREADAVVLDTGDLGAVTLPLEALAGLRTVRAEQPGFRKALESLGEAASTEDRLLLNNGDSISGFLSGMDAEGVSLETDGGEKRIPFRLIVAGRFASQFSPTRDDPLAVVTFRSGGRLTARELHWAGIAVQIRTRYNLRTRFEAERILRVDFLGGRWEWLSRREPISFTHTPMLSVGWPFVADRNVLGGPLTVAGESYERGIGVHSRSTLIYELKGEFREFVTHFGLDDDSGPYGDVSAYVLVDGVKRFEQTGIRHGKLFGPVRLDVGRAGRMELICDFGANGDIQDRFNWIEAAIIRPE
jgi:hypothetical protein